MKFLKLFLSIIFIIISIFLYTSYKKPADEKNYLYLKIRATLISKIEFIKNTKLLKYILYLRGKNYIEDDFTIKYLKKNLIF